jgi:hypothetical protein
MEAIKDKGIDKEKLEEAEKRLKELMEKAREYCQRRRDKDGKKTGN